MGSYLLRYLVKAGYSNIRALKRKESSLDLVADIKDRIEWIDGDLLDTTSLEAGMDGAKQVYHCGAMISFDKREIKKMMRTNVEGTANVVNIALDFKVKKLVHFSSIAALGRSKETKNVNENTIWQKNDLISNYSISKYLAEQEVWRGIAEGLPAAILNPSVVIGSGFWNSGTALMFREVWNGLSFYPMGSTGFVDVRDVALLAIKLMESDIVKERFLINNENISYRDFFTKIAQKMDKKPPSIKVNPALSGLAWRLDWLRSKFTGRRHLITRETASLVSHSFFYSNKKAIETFDHRFIPLETTLTETARQIAESLKLGKNFDTLPLV